mmetsp:Transcript_108514/g.305852  ORF Transcript_108514/g.305852 Transcript_108514/m.305852 type:complete len:233 (-) Transcript_108514:597-1295(-)
MRCTISPFSKQPSSETPRREAICRKSFTLRLASATSPLLLTFLSVWGVVLAPPLLAPAGCLSRASGTQPSDRMLTSAEPDAAGKVSSPPAVTTRRPESTSRRNVSALSWAISWTHKPCCSARTFTWSKLMASSCAGENKSNPGAVDEEVAVAEAVALSPSSGIICTLDDIAMILTRSPFSKQPLTSTPMWSAKRRNSCAVFLVRSANFIRNFRPAIRLQRSCSYLALSVGSS